jgi:hypothetical protein
LIIHHLQLGSGNSHTQTADTVLSQTTLFTHRFSKIAETDRLTGPSKAGTLPTLSRTMQENVLNDVTGLSPRPCFLQHRPPLVMAILTSILRRQEYQPPLTNGDFEEIGLEIFLGEYHTCSAKNERLRKFESFFGAEPLYCATLRFELQKSGWFRRAPARTVKPSHLLMALHFLKSYSTEVRAAVNFGCTEKNFRLWTWYMHVKGHF